MSARRFRMLGPRRLRRVGSFLGGQWMLLEPGEYVQGTIYWQGVWEPHVSAWLSEQLVPGATFVDVGANVGYFTLLAARAVGSAGQVIAFEPVYPGMVRLHQRLNGWENVVVCPEAAGERSGTLVIGVADAGNRGRSSAVVPERLGPPVTVPMVRVDDRVAHANVLKVDAEGYEVEVFRGASRLLGAEDAPGLVFELSPDFLRAAGHSDVELKAMLVGYGYQLFAIEPPQPGDARGYRLRPLDPLRPESIQMDVVAMRRKTAL